MPYIIPKEEEPKPLTWQQQLRELGDPLEWALTIVVFVAFIALMVYLFLGHIELRSSP